MYGAVRRVHKELTTFETMVSKGKLDRFAVGIAPVNMELVSKMEVLDFQVETKVGSTPTTGIGVASTITGIGNGFRRIRPISYPALCALPLSQVLKR